MRYKFGFQNLKPHLELFFLSLYFSPSLISLTGSLYHLSNLNPFDHPPLPLPSAFLRPLSGHSPSPLVSLLFWCTTSASLCRIASYNNLYSFFFFLLGRHLFSHFSSPFLPYKTTIGLSPSLVASEHSEFGHNWL